MVNNIDLALRQSYFKVPISDYIKYLHKQLDCCLLPSKITKLSSDRFCRLMQQTADNN